MHMMLQQPEPDDFVIATGETHSVRELCEIAFAEVDLDYREFVKVDERYYRPSEVDLLIGDASKARRVLGWEPTYTFRELIKEMVASDLAAIAHELGTRSDGGFLRAKAQRRKDRAICKSAWPLHFVSKPFPSNTGFTTGPPID